MDELGQKRWRRASAARLDWLAARAKTSRWASGLDIVASRRFGGERRLSWSSLCLSGSINSAAHHATLQIAKQALSSGMGVACAGLEETHWLLVKARSIGARSLPFGLSRTRGGLQLSSARELAWALDEGAFTGDGWGWGGLCAPPFAPGQWEGAREALEVMGEACERAKKPFLIILSLNVLERDMESTVESLIEAVKTRAPSGSKIALFLPITARPGALHLPFGRESWFDARWIGTLKTSQEPELHRLEIARRLEEQLGEQALTLLGDRARRGEPGAGEGTWMKNGSLVTEGRFPYEKMDFANQWIGYDCPRSFMARSEASDLALELGAETEQQGGESVERGALIQRRL